MEIPAEKKLTLVRNNLENWGIEGLLITSNYNRRWLSGFSGSAGWLLVTADRALLGTDFRYWEQVKSQASQFELINVRGKLREAFPKFALEAGVKVIGLESQYLTLRQFDILSTAPDITWVKLENSVEPFREIKEQSEIESIRAAASITDMVMEQVNELVQPGMSERQIAWELEKSMRELGADEMAFPIIVASGPNGARAHHEPGDRKVNSGDVIIIDMGAKINGYCSDLTRTFFMGANPIPKFEEIYDLVLHAQETALRNITAGKTGKEIDSLARDMIDSAGYGEAFGHSLGHGLGIEVHEAPRLSQLDDGSPLSPGMVVTVEPGIYLSGWGGVRIEDLVLITEEGIELLSQCPKRPLI